MACSMPPMYWSTGSQYAARSSIIARSLPALAKRKKYHDESTNVSIVSVSRRAGFPHFGQEHARKASLRFSGLPLPSGTQSSGSTTGNWSSGTGTTPHAVAVDQRDRAAPVALPRNAPVAQPPVHAPLAAAVRLEGLRDGVERFVEVEAVEATGIDQPPVLDVGARIHVDEAAVRGLDHLVDAQAVATRELPVALVMRGHRHHGARAVAHQHEVRDPHRHLLAGERMNRVDAERHAAFLHRLEHRLGDARALALGDECLQVGVARRCALRERVLGGDRHVGDAVQRIGTRRVDAQRLGILDLELELEALGAADPVGLHQLHALGPTGQRVERPEQFLRVIR